MCCQEWTCSLNQSAGDLFLKTFFCSSKLLPLCLTTNLPAAPLKPNNSFRLFNTFEKLEFQQDCCLLTKIFDSTDGFPTYSPQHGRITTFLNNGDQTADGIFGPEGTIKELQTVVQQHVTFFARGRKN